MELLEDHIMERPHLLSRQYWDIRVVKMGGKHSHLYLMEEFIMDSKRTQRRGIQEEEQ